MLPSVWPQRTEYQHQVGSSDQITISLRYSRQLCRSNMDAATSSKRPRLANGDADGHGHGSSALAATPAVPRRRHLFTPYLAMGIITNHVPFVVQVRHGGKDADKPDVNIVTSLGDSWSIWTAESLMQVFVGAQLPSSITQLALSTSPDSILASAGSTIHRFTRGKVVARYSCSQTTAAVSHFIVFGDSIVALSGSTLSHFSLSTSQLTNSIDLPSADRAVPTAIVHPTTYLHKVLLGMSNGDLALWNIRDTSLVHHFSASALFEAHGVTVNAADPVSIIALAQTPALDVIAITTSNNCILLHDIKYDTAIMTFRLEAPLSSTPPTFRTDGRAHTMALGSRSGDIFIFDLDPAASGALQKKGTDAAEPVANSPRLTHTIRNAHAEPVSGLEFVAGQPLLISSAADNAIKQWFFEPSSSTSAYDGGSGGASTSSGSASLPRLLKSREGHSEPPSLVRWYGTDGRAPLLTAGRDRSVRLGWVGREARGGELSQGSIVRKANQLSLPPTSLKLEAASSLSFSLTRSRDWDDILTVHPSSPARMWYGRDRRMNATPLMHQKSSGKKNSSSGSVATAGVVSHCGNFGIVGMSNGTVEMWNMQSGRYVRGFDTRPISYVQEESGVGTKKLKKRREVRGKGSKVVGLVADEGNKELAVVASSGGVYFFDFYSTTLLSSQQFPSLVGLRPSPQATLLALIPLGLSQPLLVLDFVTRRVVRRFGPLPARITDVTFSPTLRSLLISTMDGCLSTFDMPSGLLIDRMRLREVIVSLDWSPDGSMVAGCGTDGKGVYLWTWSSGRGRIDEDEDAPAGAEAAAEEEAAMPSVRGPAAGDEDDALEDGVRSLDLQGAHHSGEASAIPLLSGPADEDGSHPLITTTSQSRTKWATLLSLDLIKARDRPKEAPKKPKSAPFFLGASAAPPSSAMGTATAAATNINSLTKSNGRAASGSAGPRETLLESLARQDLSMSDSTPAERLLQQVTSEGGSDPQGDELFSHLLSLSPPQLDLVLRLELASMESMTRFLLACAKRLAAGRDYEAILALVESLRRSRGEEMVEGLFPSEDDEDEEAEDEAQGGEEEEGGGDEVAERRRLKLAWTEYLRAQTRAGTRIGDLLDYNVGTLSFLRGVPIV